MERGLTPVSEPSSSARRSGSLAAAPAWARSLLAGGRVARLATADARGQPSVVAVCYALIGDRVYTPIDGKPKRTVRLRRLRDLEANPRVALVVDHWDEDWSQLAWVSVRGRGGALAASLDTDTDTDALRGVGGGGRRDPSAEAEDEDERRRAIAALRAKYAQYQAAGAGPGGAGAMLPDSAIVIRIEIEEARWWRSSAAEEP